MAVSILEKWCESKEQFYLLQIGNYHLFLYVTLLDSSVVGVS
jgi:hypothetical protein